MNNLKKIINSFVFYSKINYKNPLFIVSSLFGFIYLSIMIYTYTLSEISNPGNFLQLSSFLIQGSMLVFVFLGYHAAITETKEDINNFFSSIPNSISVKSISNYFFVFVNNILFSVGSTLIILMIFYFSGYRESEIYVNSIKFIMLYWFFPNLIISLIGFYIGQISNSKINYSVLILIWLVLSPTNVYVLEPFFNILGMKEIPAFIHLGIDNPQMSYNALSGFLFPQGDLTNKYVWTLMLFLLIAIKLFNNSYSFFKFQKSLALTLIIPVLVVGFSNFQKNEKITPEKFNKRNINELDYYYNNTPEKVNSLKNFDYDIKQYDIQLSIENQLKSEVKIYFKDEEKGEKVFSLYHQFSVSSIKDEERKVVRFKQDKDFLKIYLDRPTKSIVINYKGSSSPFMEAKASHAYLPFYFSWYPVKSVNPAMKSVYNSNTRLSVYDTSKIKFNLKFNGNVQLMDSLGEKNNNTYQITSDSGINIIYGELKDKTINNYRVVYPITWENNIETIAKYIDKLRKTFNLINQVFYKKAYKFPENIYIVPGRGANDVLPTETMWYQKNKNLFILVSPYEHHNKLTFDIMSKDISYQLVGAMTWKIQNNYTENDNIPIIFNVLTTNYINKMHKIAKEEYSEGDFWISEVYDNESKKNKKYIEEIINSISTSDNDKAAKLLRRWNDLMKNKELTWYQLKNQLIESGGNK